MKKHIVLIIALALAFVGAFTYLSRDTYVNSLETFNNGGYILVASNDAYGENLNAQRYFNPGTTYQKTYDNKIVFTDINDKKVSVDTNNFVHYNNDSMSCLSNSVLLNTDSLDDTQISYYSISPKSILEKVGDKYLTNNAGQSVSFDNLVWKMSLERYMVVSDSITLVVSEDAQQTFVDYIEVQYIDDGVVHLVNHNGTYSTISSDAYLLLDNGIRIYLGSKNVSDSEGILMNLTQMVVDSDDNVEIIPDVDYNNENIEKPQIIVNATDGENGADGENGTDGELGDAGSAGDAGVSGIKGNQGAAGQAGMEGTNGLDAEPLDHSDFHFDEETMPKFFILNDDMNETFKSINPVILFDDNGCELVDGNSVTYYIIDGETSEIIWQRPVVGKDLKLVTNITDPSDSERNSLTMDGSELSIFVPNHQYTFLITADYSSNLMGEDAAGNREHVLQTVFARTFVTDGSGVDLKFNAGTPNSVEYGLNILKSIQESVEKVRIRLFDEKRNELILGTNTQEYQLEIVNNPQNLEVDNFGVITIPENPSEDINISLKFADLKSNNTYYAKYEIKYRNGASIGALDSEEYVEGHTLKIEPTISRPDLKTHNESSSLVVYPGIVNDVDSSIIKYRYEFHLVTKNGNDIIYSTDPVYSVTKYTSDPFSVVADKTSTKPEDLLNGLWKDGEYVVRTVAVLDDNETIREKYSAFSDPASLAGTVALPICNANINTYQSGSVYKGKTFASLVDGRIEITDNDRLIDANAIITVTVESLDSNIAHYNTENPSNISMSKPIKLSKSYHLNQIPLENGNEYKIPFYFLGLLQDRSYTLTVSIDQINYNGGISTDKILAVTTFDTAKYAPLYVSGIDLNSDENTQNYFDFDMFFHLDEEAYAVEKDDHKFVRFEPETAARIGAENSYDLTIKSVTALTLDIYRGDASNVNIPSSTPLNSRPLSITTVTGTKYPGTDTPKGHDFALNYTFDSDFYTNAYLTEEAWLNYLNNNTITLVGRTDEEGNPLNKFMIHVTDDNFYSDDHQDETLRTELEKYLKTNPNAKLYVKVNTLYDYTYGLGGYTSQLYTNNFVNKLQVGTENEFKGADNYKDEWIVISAKYSRPSWDLGPAYFENLIEIPNVESNEFYKEYIAQSNGKNYVTNLKPVGLNAEDNPNMELSDMDLDELKEYWKNNSIKDASVAVVIQGRNDWLATYASAVKYTIYDAEGKEITKSYNASSNGGDEGWIPFGDSITAGEDPESTMPKYVFFFDAESLKPDTSSSATTDNKISRGEYFTVEMEVKLKNFTDEVYPSRSLSLDKVNDIPKDDFGKYKTISQKFIVAKQKPTIRALDYQGVKGNSSEDIYYITLLDHDRTLTYVKDDNNQYERVVFSVNDQNVYMNVKDLVNDAPSVNEKGYFELKTHMPNAEKLLARWSDGISNTIEQPIELPNEQYITSGHSLTLDTTNGITTSVITELRKEGIITDKNVSSYEGSNVYVIPDSQGWFNTYVAINSDSADEAETLSSILSYSLTFRSTNSQSSITCDSRAKQGTANYCVMSSSDITVKHADNGNKYYVLQLGKNLLWSNFNSLMNGEDTVQFNVTLNLHYDTGNYGTYYVENGNYHFDIRADKNSDEYAATLAKFDTYKVYPQAPVVYANKSLVEWSDFDFNVNSTGIQTTGGYSILPKQVMSAVNDSNGTITRIEGNLPLATITATSVGVYYTKLDITLNGYGSLDVTKGLKLQYREFDAVNRSGEWTTYRETAGQNKVFSLLNNTLSWNAILQDLSPDTEYEFRVIGYTKYVDSDNHEQFAENPLNAIDNMSNLPPADRINSDTLYKVYYNNILENKVKTANEIKISDETMFKFVAENDNDNNPTRNSKYAEVSLVFENTTPYDIKKALETIDLKLEKLNNIDPENPTYDLVGEISGFSASDISTAVNDTNQFDRRDYTYVFGVKADKTYYLPFVPKADETHKLGDTEYLLTVTENYKTENGIAIHAPQEFTFNKDSNKWKFDRSSNRFSFVESTGKTDENVVRFVTSVYDQNRVLTGPNEKQLSFIVELHKRRLVGADLIDEIVDMNPDLTITNTGGIKKDSMSLEDVMYCEVVIGQDGDNNNITEVRAVKNPTDSYSCQPKKVMKFDTVERTSLVFNNIKIESYNPDPGSKYYIKLFTIADTENINNGPITIDEFYDHYVEFAEDYSSNYFAKTSSGVNTASSIDPEVLGIVLDFESRSLSYVGLNLNTVNRVICSIEDLTTGIIYDDIDVTGTGSGWKEIAGNYRLNIPDDIALDKKHDYYVVTSLYKNANSDNPDHVVEKTINHEDLGGGSN